MGISKALADENRVRMLLALRGRELCACQLNELFGLAASTMSKHLTILYQAGLVNSRKAGRWVYYSLPGEEAPVAVRKALEWVCESLADHARAAEDARRLKQVLKMDPTELCKRQCKS
jgi:ArsR family transcriptional regulator